MLRHGAGIKCDKYGKTPMSDAAENKQLEVSQNIHLLKSLIFFGHNHLKYLVGDNGQINFDYQMPYYRLH